MADIQIVYMEPYCDYECQYFCTQCYTEVAQDLGCKYFHTEPNGYDESGTLHIPFHDCDRARIEYKYKGWSGKRYEMEEQKDHYAPRLDCMLVTLGKTEYLCAKVILDGKCIYNNYDETEGSDNEQIIHHWEPDR